MSKHQSGELAVIIISCHSVEQGDQHLSTVWQGVTAPVRTPVCTARGSPCPDTQRSVVFSSQTPAVSSLLHCFSFNRVLMILLVISCFLVWNVVRNPPWGAILHDDKTLLRFTLNIIIKECSADDPHYPARGIFHLRVRWRLACVWVLSRSRWVPAGEVRVGVVLSDGDVAHRRSRWHRRLLEPCMVFGIAVSDNTLSTPMIRITGDDRNITLKSRSLPFWKHTFWASFGTWKWHFF